MESEYARYEEKIKELVINADEWQNKYVILQKSKNSGR